MSSTKVTFDVATLEEKVLEFHLKRIKEAQRELSGFESDDAIKEQQTAWRTRQEVRIHELVNMLKLGEEGISDFRLSRWSIDKYPERDRYDFLDAQRNVKLAKYEWERAKLKFDSLKRNEDGTISLTSAQLSDYFGIMKGNY